MLAFAGFQPGMRVLDAGCGTGSFLPLLRRAGARGLVALDAEVGHLGWIADQDPDTPAVGGVINALPLRDTSVDGVWCANTLQYLDDRQADVALAEFARVTRPGGIVAVKDVDMTAFRIAPAPPFLGAHLAEACIRGPSATVQSHGSLRGRLLRDFFCRAGLSNVRQQSFVIERWGPLTGADATFWSEWLAYLAGIALDLELPDEDLRTWAALAAPEQARAFVARPDFYGCELQVVCTGRRVG